MALTYFQNNVSDLNNLWYDSHKIIIMRVARELGHDDKCEELVNKFLGKQVKIKKQRDENLPKKAKSSFLFFCDENREQVKKENPKIKTTEVMKKLGEMWKNCDNKEKYLDLAESAKISYEEQMDEYNTNNIYY